MTARPYRQEYYGRYSGEAPGKRKERGQVTYRGEFNCFITGLPHGARILDVGCGEGRALRRIKGLRPDLELFGMDISAVSPLLPEDVKFVQGGVENLSTFYEPDMFDAVICQHVIEHLVSPLDLISGIYDILKPGGKVFIEAPNWTRLLVPFSYLYFWNDYTHIHPYSTFALSRLFLEHGFSIEFVRTLSTCNWRSPKSLRKSDEQTEKSSGAASAPSAFAHTHEQQSRIARGMAYLVNPLIRDLLIGVATKRG